VPHTFRLPIIFMSCALLLAQTNKDAESTEEWQTSWSKFVEKVDAVRKDGETSRAGYVKQLDAIRPGAGRELPYSNTAIPPEGAIIAFNENTPLNKGVWPKAEAFYREVEFEGVFRGTQEVSERIKQNLGQSFRLKIELENPPGRADLDSSLRAPFYVLHVYPKETARSAWQAATVGRRIRFRARVQAMTYFMRGGNPNVPVYMFVLTDAEVMPK